MTKEGGDGGQEPRRCMRLNELNQQADPTMALALALYHSHFCWYSIESTLLYVRSLFKIIIGAGAILESANGRIGVVVVHLSPSQGSGGFAINHRAS